MQKILYTILCFVGLKTAYASPPPSPIHTNTAETTVVQTLESKSNETTKNCTIVAERLNRESKNLLINPKHMIEKYTKNGTEHYGSTHFLKPSTPFSEYLKKDFSEFNL